MRMLSLGSRAFEPKSYKSDILGEEAIELRRSHDGHVGRLISCLAYFLRSPHAVMKSSSLPICGSENSV